MADSIPPGVEAVQLLTEIWGEVLDVEHVRTTDNFFALGGDSLSLLRVMSSLRRMNIEIPLVALISVPSLVDAAKLIEPWLADRQSNEAT